MNNSIKEKMVEVIPSKILTPIRNLIWKQKINRIYNSDKKRHINYAYYPKTQYSIENLKAAITLNYHSIEKGLSQPDVRLGFGKKAFTSLFSSMDKYIELGYSTKEPRFQQALSVIQEYVKYHESKNYPVQWITNKLNDYLQYSDLLFEGVGGYGIIRKEDLPDYRKLPFKDLAFSRHSIRDFGNDIIDDEEVSEAIKIATKTPSACNRQASKVYRIKNKEKIKKTIQLQGGLTTHGQNVREILLVTCNKELMMGKERNQTFIDGGMFAMSLIYALTYHNIATCTLNTAFTNGKHEETRRFLGIPEPEDFIVFIALGSFRNENKYAKSPRDRVEDIMIEI